MWGNDLPIVTISVCPVGERNVPVATVKVARGLTVEGPLNDGLLIELIAMRLVARAPPALLGPGFEIPCNVSDWGWFNRPTFGDIVLIID